MGLMRSIAWICMVGGLGAVIATVPGAERVTAQQGRAKEPAVTRMFTGPDGLSHLEPIDMPAAEIKVAAVRFSRASVKNPNLAALEYHPEPGRRWVITLSGARELIMSGDNNKKIVLDRDQILLAEDTTGKGHAARFIGPEDWVALLVDVERRPQRPYGEGVAVQQGQAKEPAVTRMFTGPDGLSHLETIPMPASEIPAAAMRFARVSPRNANAPAPEFHPESRRHWVITLSGAVEIVVSGDNNKKFIADREHIILAEDMTGRGHISRVVGPEDWVAVLVDLAPEPQSVPAR